MRVRAGLPVLILSVAVGLALVSATVAEEAVQPLEFDVRPSGVEPETAEERLNRRLKAREHLFRSICVHCGPGDRFQSNAPFSPFEALRKPIPE